MVMVMVMVVVMVRRVRVKVTAMHPKVYYPNLIPRPLP